MRAVLALLAAGSFVNCAEKGSPSPEAETATGGATGSAQGGAGGGGFATSGSTGASSGFPGLGGEPNGGAMPGGGHGAIAGMSGTPNGGHPSTGGNGAGGTNTAGTSTAVANLGGNSPNADAPNAGRAGDMSNAGRGGRPNSAGGAGTGGGAGSAPCAAASTLKDAGACTSRLVGTALATSHLQESAYATAAREFNYTTPEDEMKWQTTEPSRNQFNFGPGDQIVNFAMQNGMKVKGHTLVWYNQLPAWVSAISDASDLRSAMTNHVTNVMKHYRGKVSAWDVVNEAWDPSDPTMLRDSVFTRVLGKSYIDDAFTAARAADPDAKLYYNDYGTDGLSTKANSVYDMVKDLKSRGIPIDGVGLQMHWRSVGSTLTAGEVAQNIQRLGALGLEVVISEMDVQLCKGGTLDDQKAKFHDIVAACLSQPNCTAVTFWGITDKYSWLNSQDLGCSASEKPRPLLWDDGYAKKSAYDGVMDAFLGR
jgi:endo-1,4-beta-xylanase